MTLQAGITVIPAEALRLRGNYFFCLNFMWQNGANNDRPAAHKMLQAIFFYFRGFSFPVPVAYM